jgi:hypothetical protein
MYATPKGEYFEWYHLSTFESHAELVGDFGRATVSIDAPDVTLTRFPPLVDIRLTVHGMTFDRYATYQREGWSGPVFRDSFFLRGSDAVSTHQIRPWQYSLWIPAVEGDNRCALVTGVKPGDVEVTLTPALEVGFHVELPSDASIVRAEVLGPLGTALPASPAAEGRYVARGLPSGTWTARVEARSPKGPLTGEAPVRTGQDAVVKLWAR